MDKRVIFCVLLVMLSGTFVGTYAESAQNNTATPTGNMTATAVTSPPSVSTTLASNVTASNMTTTTGNTVTSPGNMSTTPTGNMTATAGNTVTSPGNMSTTPTGNMTATAGNTVTSLGNMSTTPTGNMTATAENTVTSVSMTASTQNATVSPNTTVLTLETNITNEECGSQQLCVSEPSNCNPSVPGSCFFLAAKQQSGRNFNFDLSGESDGYIAATLKGGAGEGDPTYVCANSKGKVKFFSTILNNSVLTTSQLNVNSVKGKIKGKTIQCRFLATVPEPKTRATTLGVEVSTGEYNDTNDSLGAPAPVIRVSAVDLANPTNNVTNEITNTTTPASNMTTLAPTTVAPPGALISTLLTTITRQECGSSKLCAAEPSKCDPAAGDSCYFLSVKQERNQIYNFELSGQSEGYVAAGLSTSETQNGTHTAYICANNNGSVRFFSGTIENLEINLKESQNSSNEMGKVAGNKIQCTFSADVPDTTLRAAGYALSVSTGSYDPKTFQLGKAKFQLLTSRTNLSDPTANLINLLNNFAPSLLTPTRSFLPALMVTVCMLGFTAM